MLHDLAIHVANLAEDESVKVVIDAVLRPFGEVVTRQVAKRFHLRSQDDDLDSMKIEMTRIQEMLSAMKAEFERMGIYGAAWEQARAEVQEPSVRRFVDAATDVSADTTLESKRLLAGVLVARRLVVATDSDEEILLRRTLVTIQDLSENQLRLLAAAVLVQAPPVGPEMLPFPRRDDAEAYLRREYLKLATELISTLQFGKADFGVLASVGAIRLKEEGNALLISEDVNPYEQWVQRNCGDLYEVLEGDWGTTASHEAYARRFPTITMVGQIAAGAQDSDNFGRRLDSIMMTPLGTMIGELVFDQLLDMHEQAALAAGEPEEISPA
jgi:hypothetical protein